MKLHTAAILVFLCLGIFTVHTAKGSAGSQSMRKARCVNLRTRKLNIQNLVGYEKHHIPISAIVFITRNGISICVSPDQKWVQAAMKKIDQRSASSRNGISQFSLTSETPKTRHHSPTPLPTTPLAGWGRELETQKVTSQKEIHDLKEASSVKETSQADNSQDSQAYALPALKTLTNGTEAPSQQLQ
ncbi:lymphotactin-like [Myiozetetes cayanensis]|uniref:lymphotactin-like n=1 Tax=Myiozetetes cayanensis TaxID=478635 RepID=UPI0021606CAF|nr:lymphotactin-like [Myiozetetes cayanensis]